ncbi:MAG: branched-chain amino acid ABC transporter permease [Gammaproteobacteria bacterium]|nr:branched-chain amino acid ABC transporter permease [Gammaproteobacteria bacterium]MDH3858283.1 branched-chain amino acid ABC transporter permease [Gammaproteobacteria bacterium]
MSNSRKTQLAFALVAVLLIIIGVVQSWNVSLGILNLCLISALMALGVNMQWGYAGLLNVGVMGFAALGGMSAVLVSQAPIAEAWQASWSRLLVAALCFAATIALSILCFRKLAAGRRRGLALTVVIVAGLALTRLFLDPAVSAIESIEPAKTGFLGGMGLPIIFSWIFGGLVAAGIAWCIGKVALGLRADYLAIATLGISEIILAVLKNEDWLTRGVKNVTGLTRPVPYEIDLQTAPWFIEMISWWHRGSLEVLAEADQQQALKQFVIDGSSIFVKLCYTGLFAGVLIIILLLSVKALHSPWGRMMRAIRDNETAAGAMGKDVTRRHLEIFVIGSAVIGIAGAMLTTLDGQFTPTSYQPLRYTFLIWVMVIVGGSGNNMGSVLGGFLIWLVWIEAEPIGVWIMEFGTSWLDEGNAIRVHLIENAQHMRLFFMGLVLLLVLRFSPGGILPETIRKQGA